MSGFYVGIAKCGCERAWLIDDDETTPKEVADFARRQQRMKRSMKHVERLNMATAPDCTNTRSRPMTAETDLLPLPWIDRYAVVGDIAYPVSSDPDGDYVAYDDHVTAMQSYARANLAELQREVEGLRAEVERLEIAGRLHSGTADLAINAVRAAEARAERLAEALREVRVIANQARVAYSGDHSSGTFRAIAAKIDAALEQETTNG